MHRAPWVYRAVLSAILVAGCKGSTGSEPPGPPTGLQVTSRIPESVVVGTPLPDSVSVRVVDAKGKGVPNATVRWAVTRGFGTVGPQEVLSDRAGLARAAWTVGTRSGEQRLTATVLTAEGSSTQMIVTTAVPGPTATVRVTPSSLRLKPGETQPLSAALSDGYANPVTGVAVSWSSSSDGVASVDGSGRVTAKVPGSAEIRASAGGVVGRASVVVTTTLPGTPNAVQFDGADDYVQVADANGFDAATGDFTWEVWLKRSRTSTREDVLSKKDVLKDSEHDVVLYIESDGRATAFLRDSPYSGSTATVSSRTLVGTEWTHLAMSRSGGVVRLYLDGTLEGTANASINVSSTGPFRMGANRANNTGTDGAPVFPFAGQLHEVRVWSVARTGAQIAEGLLHCFSRGTPGLVAHYRFDEGSGTVVRDATGNGHDGVLRNGPVWTGGSPRCPTP